MEKQINNSIINHVSPCLCWYRKVYYKTTDHRQATDPPTGPPPTHQHVFHRPTEHRSTDHIRTDLPTTDFKTVSILILVTITFCVCY